MTPNPLKPFLCKNCRVSFGDTDGVRLFCGENAIFTLKVTITCRKCGTVRMWRPVALEETGETVRHTEAKVREQPQTEVQAQLQAN